MSGDKEGQVLYFAYGTLLGTAAMSEYCPAAAPVGQATLTGYEFCFERFGPGPAEGGCSLVSVEGATTKGLLYQMPASDWATLREASGEHIGYEVLPITVVLEDGTPVAANTLTVKGPIGPFRPSDQYLSLVIDGAASAGLPHDYRAKLDGLVARTKILSGA